MSEETKVLRDGERGQMSFEPLAQRLMITFAEVGGLDELKRLANLRVIQPFRHPELFQRFKQSAGGGILLYGPPGCGKTFFARAIAGECGAAFFNVEIGDILDMYLGNSESNIQRLFETAREHRPAVIFIDEIDALGRRRDLMRHSSLSTTVNAFLAQMDGLASENSNLLVLAATNAPWDVDSAFRRPGRFDRVLFVPPPDTQSRQAILNLMLSGIPQQGLDTSILADKTTHFSGADLKGVVDRAAEGVIESIIDTGQERSLTQSDLERVISDAKPTTSEWFASAANVVEYANEGGLYDELAAWLQTYRPKRRIGFF